jgi:F-box and WD-40 domain protein 1/11
MKCILPRLWGALSSQTRKGRRKATTRRKAYNSMPPNISYADLLPLDGEEGELIDEACYVDSGDVPYYSPQIFAGSFPIFLFVDVF